MSTASALAIADCLISLTAIAPPAPRFTDFPVPSEHIARPATPVIAGRTAWEFRSQLRAAASGGANFAGHYALATWGCGAGCLMWGVIDERTGQVHFDPAIQTLDVYAVDLSGPNAEALNFRRDSRLLIILGAPHEDETRNGASFYLWNGASFRLLKFVPQSRACRPDAG
jgi:hypothetical protein